MVRGFTVRPSSARVTAPALAAIVSLITATTAALGATSWAVAEPSRVLVNQTADRGTSVLSLTTRADTTSGPQTHGAARGHRSLLVLRSRRQAALVNFAEADAPRGARVVSATLRIYVQDPGFASRVALYAARDGWGEHGAVSTRDAVVGHRLGAEVRVGRRSGWLNVPLRRPTDLGSTTSLALKRTGGGSTLRLASRESSRPPRLILSLSSTTTKKTPRPKPTSSVPTAATTDPAVTSTASPVPTPSTSWSSAAVPAPLAEHVVFGLAEPDLPYGRHDLPAMEAALGTGVGLASTFVDWSYVIGGPNELWMADGGRRSVLLSWEPFGLRFTDVSNGSEDRYLQRVADSMRAFPYDVYVRPWPEMNGSWSTWQPTATGQKPDGGTPAQFVAAWRYTVDFMRNRGVANLKFVFDPDASDGSSNTRIAEIWPGPSYVDVLGIDGYNWGNSATGSADTGDRWRSFDTVFGPMYDTLTRLHPTAPVWITEFGCKDPTSEDDPNFPQESSPVDPGHDKAAWIRDMFASTAFPRITALAWFDIKGGRDWRLAAPQRTIPELNSLLSAMP